MTRLACVVAAGVALAQAVRFEPVQPELFAAGANLVNAWADYDGDGDPDLFVGFDGAPNRLYQNNKGTFVDVASSVGLADARSTRAAAWGDFDADGDPDLFVGFTPGAAGPVTRVYRNDGAASRGADLAAPSPGAPKGAPLPVKFADVTNETGISVPAGAVRQPVWIDYDGDGDLDLFIGFRDRANALFRNDAGAFTDIAAEIGLADPRKTVGAVWFDFDQDGDLDVAVANMDGDANGLFRNENGKFSDVAEHAGVQWGGRKPVDKATGTVRVCAADVDNDGRFDLFHANYGKNGLFLNQANGTFKDVSSAWGIDIDSRYDTCAFEDFDNDGRIDLYVNGTVTGGKSYPDYLFRNMGDRFADVTPAQLHVEADHGAAWADYDGDGDADLALAGSQKNAMHLLFQNLLPAADAARSLEIRAVDAQGRTTLAGAEVRVFAAGTTTLLGARLVDSGSGYDAQSDTPVHIGLPALLPVDVELVVPRGGKRMSAKQMRVDPRKLQGKVLTLPFK